jgi:sentrin-specific protease 1
MARERVQELLSEFHKFRIDEPYNGYYKLLPDCEINQYYVERIETILTNPRIMMSDNVIVNDKAKYSLTKASLGRLRPGVWFNDEIVNSYAAFVNDNSRKKNSKTSYTFDSFFYTKIELMV